MDGDELADRNFLGQFASKFQRNVSKYEVNDIVDDEQRKD